MPLSGIGFGEMLVIAMLVLIVFGPQRLPEITRQLGKTIREFKRGMNEIQRELEVADREKRWASAASTTTSSTAAAATSAGGLTSAGTETAAEPVIAPPTFGSDLPDEVESQLSPPPTETAARPPPAETSEPVTDGASEPAEPAREE